MDTRSSSVHKAYHEIRRKIQTFSLVPAARINEVNLANDLNISRTPLREALNRLVAEGLLVERDRGFSVADLEPEVVKDAFEARIEVECATTRLACERATDEELAKLAEFVSMSAAESPDASVEHLVMLDCKFHETIAELSRNSELLRILRNLNDRIYLIRWIAMDDKRSITQEEHRQILETLRKRDREEAERLIRAHILHRTDEVLSAIKSAYAHVYTIRFGKTQ